MSRSSSARADRSGPLRAGQSFPSDHLRGLGDLRASRTRVPRFVEDGWALRGGAPMLKCSTFMPNHTKISPYNAIIYLGLRAVETGRLDPKEAAMLVVEEIESELGDDVIILD